MDIGYKTDTGVPIETLNGYQIQILEYLLQFSMDIDIKRYQRIPKDSKEIHISVSFGIH